MMPPTDYQKKLYLVLGMALMGCVLLGSLYAFRSGDDTTDTTVSEGNIVSPQTDFNITLDTLDASSRSAFYRKERERDTVLMASPFDKKNGEGNGSQHLGRDQCIGRDGTPKCR